MVYLFEINPGIFFWGGEEKQNKKCGQKYCNNMINKNKIEEKNHHKMKLISLFFLFKNAKYFQTDKH